MLISNRIQTLLQEFNSKTFWIAFSGGLDSHVLLMAVHEIRQFFPEQRFKAIHVNHGLSPNAIAWQNHCVQICQNLQIPLEIITVDASPKKGESPEAAARAARYNSMRNLLAVDDCLLTAHHQNDQAETVLLQLFRGSGPKGLAAMPVIKKFGSGYLVRPLLEFTRLELTEYANANQLQWIEDESNLSHNFDRNYLRHEIMPLLQSRWPQISKTLQRAAVHQAMSTEIHHELAEIDLASCLKKSNQTLSVTKLLNLSAARRNNLLRHWLTDLSLPVPNVTQIEKLTTDVILSTPDAKPILRWGNVIIRRYRDDLYAMTQLPATAVDASISLSWQLNNNDSINLPFELGTLTATQCYGQGAALGTTDNLIIRFRQGGEKLRPQGRKETHTLKNLWQEWGVPPWLRDKIPLIYANDQLVTVVGYCVTADFAASPGETGWQFILE